MNANTYGFQPGMKVYVQRRRWNGVETTPEELSEQTILKIGRRWIDITGGNRFDPEHMAIDGKGYGMTDKVWTSREEYAETITVNKVWRDFNSRLRHSPPDGMTVEKVQQMADICGITLKVQD